MPLQIITAPTAEPIDLIEAKLHVRETSTAQDTLISAFISAARRMAEIRTQQQIIAARYKQVLDSFPGPSLYGVPAGEPFTLPKHAILLHRASVFNITSVQYYALDGTFNTMDAADYTYDLTSAPARITPVFGKLWPVPVLPQIGSVVVTFDAGMASKITTDAASDTITPHLWKTLAVGDPVRLSNSGGALPLPLQPSTDYYVQSVPVAGTYKLAATSGGAAIDITSAGTGTSFIGVVEPDLRAWMLLAIGTLYENRESITVDAHITSVELPAEFLEGLLDSSRMRLY